METPRKSLPVTRRRWYEHAFRGAACMIAALVVIWQFKKALTPTSVALAALCGAAWAVASYFGNAAACKKAEAEQAKGKQTAAEQTDVEAEQTEAEQTEAEQAAAPPHEG